MSLGQSVPQSLLLPTQPTPHSSSLPPAHRHQLLISQSHSSLTAGPPMSDGSSKLCLLVRHFPAWLNRDEKESLLRHFGAQDVFVMATKGKMVNQMYFCVIVVNVVFSLCIIEDSTSLYKERWSLGTRLVKRSRKEYGVRITSL